MCRNNPRIALLVATLAGCSTFDQPAPAPIRPAAFVHVELVDSFANPSQRGQAICNGSVCKVQILRKYYPFCLQHEMRHVFEGASLDVIGTWFDYDPETETSTAREGWHFNVRSVDPIEWPASVTQYQPASPWRVWA